jgi:hypothetical protein
MKAIVVTDQAAGTAGMKLVERPEPQAARLASLSGASYGDVVVQVHASGFTWDELAWPSTWIDRLGRDRTPSIPGHELAGVVSAFFSTPFQPRDGGALQHRSPRTYPLAVHVRRRYGISFCSGWSTASPTLRPVATISAIFSSDVALMVRCTILRRK